MDDNTIKDLLNMLIENTKELRDELKSLRREVEERKMKNYPEHWNMKSSLDLGND